MTFQASDLKSQHFLELYDSNDKSIEPSYSKGGSWLKFFGHSNSLYTRVTRAIMNHAPIGKYRMKFFLRENFNYLYREYSIETRHHILYKYKRYDEYWNPSRDLISYFILFLEFNSNMFAFMSSNT